VKRAALAIGVVALLLVFGFVGKRLSENDSAHHSAVDKCVAIFMRDYDSATVAQRQLGMTFSPLGVVGTPTALSVHARLRRER
jgi:hypothetical protein